MNHVSPFLTVVDSSPFVGADNKLCASRPVNSGYIMSTTRYVRRSNYVTDTVVVGPLDQQFSTRPTARWNFCGYNRN
ncbi:hypothetical protein V1477_012828 [Vespula maculifrons]|nr:hypothetical protein HZH66_008812 [Vespula vulgaris]